jgi:hypothetical protein
LYLSHDERIAHRRECAREVGETAIIHIYLFI